MSALVHRRDVDGLRAVAVLAVVGYHAFPNFVRGGFVGVDVFFVISGYLITGILIRDATAGTAAIAGFYARRIRRILPALVIVLAASLLFGWVVLLPGEFRELGRHGVAAALFSSNFLLWHESGYFDAAADTKPLLHLWSLAIEEQFYVLYPVLMLSVLPRWPRARAWLLGGMAAVSLALCVAGVGQDPTGSFFSPLPRAWELLAGGMLAMAERQGDAANARTAGYAGLRKSAWAMSLAGGLLIAYASLNYDRSQPYPGARAIVPVLGAVLIIAAGPQTWLNRQVLGARWAVGMGLASYPLYLWHWPVLKLYLIAYGDLVSAGERLALVLLSVVLACLTYVAIERKLRRCTGRAVPATLLAALLVVGAVGGLAAAGRLAPRQSATGLESILRAATDWQFPPPRFRLELFEGRRFFVQHSSRPETVLFIGDSNVQQYGPRLSMLLSKDPALHETVVFATRGGCLPVPDLAGAPPGCLEHLASALRYAARSEVNRVVLGGYWLNLPPGAARRDAMPALGRLVARLAATKQVFVLMNIPSGPEFEPRNMFEGSRFGQLRPGAHPRPLSMSAFQQEYGELRESLRATAEGAGAVAVDPVPWLCAAESCPVMTDDGQPLYMDGHHMRPFHALRATGYLDALVQAPKDAGR